MRKMLSNSMTCGVWA